jgi:hypothetical protein
MLFHTWPFLVFMLIVLPVFYALRNTRWWIPWLMAASYFFYGWWNPYYLLLVFYATVLDYFLVALMSRPVCFVCDLMIGCSRRPFSRRWRRRWPS